MLGNDRKLANQGSHLKLISKHENFILLSARVFRLGASVSTLGTTVAASPLELELQAKLAAVQAELHAVKAKQVSHQQELGLVTDIDRDKLYRRMDAELWDQLLLAQDSWSKLFCRVCAGS